MWLANDGSAFMAENNIQPGCPHNKATAFFVTQKLVIYRIRNKQILFPIFWKFRKQSVYGSPNMY